MKITRKVETTEELDVDVLDVMEITEYNMTLAGGSVVYHNTDYGIAAAGVRRELQKRLRLALAEMKTMDETILEMGKRISSRPVSAAAGVQEGAPFRVGDQISLKSDGKVLVVCTKGKWASMESGRNNQAEARNGDVYYLMNGRSYYMRAADAGGYQVAWRPPHREALREV